VVHRQDPDLTRLDDCNPRKIRSICKCRKTDAVTPPISGAPAALIIVRTRKKAFKLRPGRLRDPALWPISGLAFRRGASEQRAGPGQLEIPGFQQICARTHSHLLKAADAPLRGQSLDFKWQGENEDEV